MVGVILATLSDENENRHGEQLWADFIFRNILDASQFFCSKTKCGRFSCTKDKFSDSKYNYLRYSRSQMKQFRWLKIKKPKHPSLFRVFPIMEQITLKPMCFVAQTDQVLRGPRRPTEKNALRRSHNKTLE